MYIKWAMLTLLEFSLLLKIKSIAALRVGLRLRRTAPLLQVYSPACTSNVQTLKSSCKSTPGASSRLQLKRNS